MTAMSKTHPGWQPPAELIRLLNEIKVDAAVQDGQRLHQPKRIVSAYNAYPEFFDCSHQYRRLALADAWLEQNQPRQSLQVYRVIHGQCKEYLRLQALEHAVTRMSLQDMSTLLKLAESKPISRSERPRMAALQLRHLLRQSQQGGENVAPQDLLARADALQADVLGIKSPSVASSLGWFNLDQKRPAKALELFALSRSWQDSNDALKGEILADYDLGRFAEMQQLILKNRQRLADAGMLMDVLPLEAAYCAREKNYACQLDTLNQMEQERPLDAGERKSRAWALYHTGDYSGAAKIFESLYRTQPDADIGQGLYYSLQQSGEMNRANQLARQFGGSLAEVAGSSDAQRLFDRGLFHAAQDVDAAYHPALEHVATPYLRTGFMRRVQSSSAPVPLLSTFELRKYILETGVYVTKLDSLNLQVERTFINAGDPLARAADVGLQLPGPYGFSIKSFLQGYEWDVEYRHEGWSTWYASIGQGFVGGPIKAAIKGNLGAVYRYEHGQFNAELYRQPLRDRIFAYVGMTEPTTGQHWGRVSRNGLKLDGYHGWGDSPWGFSYQASAELLNGINVASNKHYAVSLTLPYSFRLAAADSVQASIGPQVRWQHYAQNQNHFTFGHGGYFSPQKDVAYGLSAHASSDEGQRMHFIADGFIGKRSHTQDVSPFSPLGIAGVAYPATTVRETVYSGRLAAVGRVTGHLQLGADVSYWKSSYAVLNLPVRINDLGWMAYVTWQFDGRIGSLSMDHPARGLSPLY